MKHELNQVFILKERNLTLIQGENGKKVDFSSEDIGT
jgi:hypothetical protein